MREPGSRFSASVVKTVLTSGGGAFDLARGDGEALAGDEQDGLVVYEVAGADLGALQVGEDADGLALFAATCAHHADELGLLRVGAVREVEAGDVEAGADELAEDLDSAAGGAEGGDDLGAAGEVDAQGRAASVHRSWRFRACGVRHRWRRIFLTVRCSVSWVLESGF